MTLRGLPQAAISEEDVAWGRQIADAVVQYPLPSHWKTLTSPSGDVYYWNQVTEQTTWCHPLTNAAGELLEALRDCKTSGDLAASPTLGALAQRRRLQAWVQHWHQEACEELGSWRSVAGEAAGAPTYYYKVSATGAAEEASGNLATTWEDPRATWELRLRFEAETLACLLSLPVPEIEAPIQGDSTGVRQSSSCPSAAASAAMPEFGGAVSSGVDAAGMKGGLAASPHRASSSGASQRRVRTEEVSRSSRGASLRGSSLGRIGTTSASTSSRRLRRAEDGKWFQVEALPADHSCGFHGLGITREDAAALLLRHKGDPEVQEFVAADLVAAVQTGERRTFPRKIRDDEDLWRALSAYYAAQQGLDQSRREARDCLAEDASLDAGDSACGNPSSVQAADATMEGKAGDVAETLLGLCAKLKARASAMHSGSAKTGLMHRLGRCKAQAKAMQSAALRNCDADKALRKRCSHRLNEYVSWVGTDRSFWLSFVRGCGNERTGGLLDALAKVCNLTVCIWAEKLAAHENWRTPCAEEPELELVHEATFGGKTIHLWYQGDCGHFDRLVPYSRKVGHRNGR